MLNNFLDPNCITNTSFFNTIKDLIICNLCSGILQNPQECKLCQNSFCKKCLEDWRIINTSCPYFCEEISFGESPKSLRNLLEKLFFKCKFCSKTFEKNLGEDNFIDINYFSYSNFLIHNETCKKIKISCPTCNSEIYKSEIKKEIKENFPFDNLRKNYEKLLKEFDYMENENQKMKKEISLLKKIKEKNNMINNNNVNNDINNNINNIDKKNSCKNLSMTFSNCLKINPSINKNSNLSKIKIKNKNKIENGIIDKCEHFMGNYIPIFSCCEKSYSCYICHNIKENHEYVISDRVICLICKNIYKGNKCHSCDSIQIYRMKKIEIDGLNI